MTFAGLSVTTDALHGQVSLRERDTVGTNTVGTNTVGTNSELCR